jgi:hypothetical protein
VDINLTGTFSVLIVPGWEERAEALARGAEWLCYTLGAYVALAKTSEEGNIDLFADMLGCNKLLLRQIASRGDPIVLVGYSRGGLNSVMFAQYLIRECGVEPSRIQIIAVATPWYGSPLAHLTRKEAGCQMIMGAPELQQLRTLCDQLEEAGVTVVNRQFEIDAVVPSGATRGEVIPGTIGHYSIHWLRTWREIIEIIGRWLSSEEAAAGTASKRELRIVTG